MLDEWSRKSTPTRGDWTKEEGESPEDILRERLRGCSEGPGPEAGASQGEAVCLQGKEAVRETGEAGH